MKTIPTILAAIALVAPAFAAASDEDLAARIADAEKRLQEAAAELAELNLKMHGGPIEHVFRAIGPGGPGHPGRAMLGINIGRIEIVREDGTGETPGETPDGVPVLGVTPGGPAEAAGLQAGDVLVALNGESLADGPEPATRRLTGLMREVEPGDSVTVRYRRDDVERTAEIVTEAFGPRALSFEHGPGVDIELLREGVGEAMRHMPPPFAGLMHHRAWHGIELVPLNPELGRYFGTDKGLLVVRAPGEGLPLQAGDVILTIGGATPGNVPDAMRLLRFYQPGDKLVLEIMRDKRGRTLQVAVPERSSR